MPVTIMMREKKLIASEIVKKMGVKEVDPLYKIYVKDLLKLKIGTLQQLKFKYRGK